MLNFSKDNFGGELDAFAKSLMQSSRVSGKRKKMLTIVRKGIEMQIAPNELKKWKAAGWKKK